MWQDRKTIRPSRRQWAAAHKRVGKILAELKSLLSTEEKLVTEAGDWLAVVAGLTRRSSQARTADECDVTLRLTHEGAHGFTLVFGPPAGHVPDRLGWVRLVTATPARVLHLLRYWLEKR